MHAKCPLPFRHVNTSFRGLNFDLAVPHGVLLLKVILTLESDYSKTLMYSNICSEVKGEKSEVLT